MCDLLWADPYEDFDSDAGPKYEHNHVRGCSYFFRYILVVKSKSNVHCFG
jgi:serine/threonine-protein phosphatase 2B catalytic subunit